MRAYVGIDLAAKESRCSGFAYILCSGVCRVAEVKCLYTDGDIIEAVVALVEHHPYVSIDAPFSLGSGMRDVDRRMISMGFRVLPPGFSYMKSLTLRAVRIVESLRAMGISSVYETHPRSSLTHSGCGDVEEVLRSLGIAFTTNLSRLGRDLVDAILCAAVSYCIDFKCCTVVEGADGAIWILGRICGVGQWPASYG